MAIYNINSDNYYKDDWSRDRRETILMQAAKAADVTLVKSILENADPQILEMRDHLGYTALRFVLTHHANTTDQVTNQVECVRALIEGGADINAVWGRVDMEHGENALGFCARLLSADGYASLCPENSQALEAITELLIASGATYVLDGGTICLNKTDRERYYRLHHKIYLDGFNIDDPINPHDRTRKAGDLRVLQRIKARVMEKKDKAAKLLVLGVSKDQGSILNGMPSDLMKLMLSKIYSNS